MSDAISQPAAGARRARPPLIQTSVQLEPEHLRLLDQRADAEGLRRSQIIRRAIDRYFGLRQSGVLNEVSP